MNTWVIETSGLTRRFGDLVAVQKLGLRVPTGGVYGFLGPNGSGKTTTIRMLLGLIRPDAGTVELFGRPLRRERRLLMGRIGSMVESPSLYPNLTGHENLRVITRLTGASEKAIDHALHTVRLDDAAHRLVRGYSTGMRQRLGLAMALLHEPELLILDEPTNGLDPAGIREMRELIRELPRERGITVFLSSHLLSEVEHVATDIGIIRQGELVFQGDLAALRAERQGRLVVQTTRPQQALDILHGAGWDAWLLADDGALPQVAIAAADPATAARINASLVSAGIDVCALAMDKPTLEELFMGLTGPAAQPAHNAAPQAALEVTPC